MAWDVEHTDEFAEWYHGLSEAQQDDVTAAGLLLIEQGPQLPFPYSSGIEGSKHAHMRELRVQSGGDPYRVFYAFDPRRTAILLIGGGKAREKSQSDLARSLKVQQPAVAKLERRADMYVSNLRRYIEALGGELEITAHFPDGTVTIADVGEADASDE